MVVSPSEPLLFGHMLVNEQLTLACHHQTNDFTLSRPRDFISALTKEKNSSEACSSGNNSHMFTVPVKNIQSSSQVKTNTYNPINTSTDRSLALTASEHPLSTQTEHERSSLSCTATNSHYRFTECRNICSSSPGSDKALGLNEEINSETEEAEKTER